MRFEIPGSVFESILTEKNPVTLISDIQSLSKPTLFGIVKGEKYPYGRNRRVVPAT